MAERFQFSTLEADMGEPEGWDDPREKPGTEERRRGLLRAPNEAPSPRILKLALVAAAIIVAIALILYFKARNAPPALRDDLRGAPTSCACNISPIATSISEN
jgi:hypothetical protein